ncbi:hypothetical protein BC628DRAFT_1307634 [Trametes gibbosa]|nr:hypothetical protein BC628DRAFT_1322701 [Trametes gibbosa]KAI0833511.1 hypothetical protein BC628DRAFT_1307634 [Trametes gibbosa]
MDVDDTPQAPGEKKRKRAQSNIAAIAPDQEERGTENVSHSAAKKSKTVKVVQPQSGARTMPTKKSQPEAVQVQPQPQRPPPPSNVSRRRGALKTINVDAPPSDDEFVEAPASEEREDHLNNDGEDEDGKDKLEDEDQDDGEEPESHDEGVLDNLAAEVLPSSPAASVQSTSTSTNAAAQDSKEAVVRAMPAISAGKAITKPSKQALSKQAAEFSESETDSDSDSIPWLPRTDISRALKKVTKNTQSVGLNDCRIEMKRVLRTSFGIGISNLAMGYGPALTDPEEAKEMMTPFASQGIDQISLGALILAAKRLGYDQDYDIAHRLEEGSERHYVAPLRNYTAHRLRTYRTELKRAASSAYPSAVHLSTMTAASRHKLLESSNFIYPRSPDGKFLYTRPFSGPGLDEVVRALFFGESLPYKIGSQNLDKFTSALPTASHELEIPDAMLAMAATAIHSVLIDHINPATAGSDRTTEFSGPALHGAFQAYMGILVGLCVTAPGTYHALMHEKCMTVSGGNAVMNQGNGIPMHNAILANVDWANIAANA